MATTVTSKGQVTIPKVVRDMLGLEPGSKVVFSRLPSGDIVLQREDGTPPKSRFAALVGHADGGLTTDEIMKMTRGENWPEE